MTIMRARPAKRVYPAPSLTPSANDRTMPEIAGTYPTGRLPMSEERTTAGAEVKIVDNRTKEDLTSITLAQIIFEEEKKTSKMSLEMLRELIRHGGEMAQRFVEGTGAELRGRVEAV